MGLPYGGMAEPPRDGEFRRPSRGSRLVSAVCRSFGPASPMDTRPVIAIDGPAGAGKSTAARLLAEALGYRFLDSGALYRAVTLKALRRGLDPADEGRVASLAEGARIDLRYEEGRTAVELDGEDVSSEIRGPDVTTAVSTVAALPRVRQVMVRFQRAFAMGGGVVAEGRDIGTVVFPDADVKFYLDAAPEVRAARRAAEHGAEDVNEVEAELRARDHKDIRRAVAPLRPADDAVRLDTSELDVNQVVDLMVARVNELRGDDDVRDGGL